MARSKRPRRGRDQPRHRFRSRPGNPRKQAAGVMQRLQGTRIRSVGTVRSYQERLAQVAARLDIPLEKLTPATAVAYLERRAAEVGQKTLDMERQAIQAMMRHVTMQLPPGGTLRVVKAARGQTLESRAYSPPQVRLVAARQAERNALTTEIVHASGIRAHELLTLARPAEQPPHDRVRQEPSPAVRRQPLDDTVQDRSDPHRSPVPRAQVAGAAHAVSAIASRGRQVEAPAALPAMPAAGIRLAGRAGATCTGAPGRLRRRHTRQVAAHQRRETPLARARYPLLPELAEEVLETRHDPRPQAIVRQLLGGEPRHRHALVAVVQVGNDGLDASRRTTLRDDAIEAPPAVCPAIALALRVLLDAGGFLVLRPTGSVFDTTGTPLRFLRIDLVGAGCPVGRLQRCDPAPRPAGAVSSTRAINGPSCLPGGSRLGLPSCSPPPAAYQLGHRRVEFLPGQQPAPEGLAEIPRSPGCAVHRHQQAVPHQCRHGGGERRVRLDARHRHQPRTRLPSTRTRRSRSTSPPPSAAPPRPVERQFRLSR